MNLREKKLKMKNARITQVNITGHDSDLLDWEKREIYTEFWWGKFWSQLWEDYYT
jgi:hypothetical protein